jgi:ribosome-associated protein
MARLGHNACRLTATLRSSDEGFARTLGGWQLIHRRKLFLQPGRFASQFGRVAGQGATDTWGAQLSQKRILFFDKIQDHMQEVTFSLNSEFVELNQLLKLVGICDSGGAGKMLVASGDVSVDGKVELRKTCKVRAGQTVSLHDIRIKVVAE